MRRLITASFMLSCWIGSHAQVPVITDNLMMAKKELGLGLFYGNESWKSYWEGDLKRQNQNIGILVSQSMTLAGAYGVSDKVTLVAMVPYIKTRAGGGTLHAMEGLQDLTISGKYNFFKKDFENSSVSFMALGTVSFPMSNYSFDFMPLSIGMGCVNISGRATVNYSYKRWYIMGSGNYTWRSNVYLDRPAYYTNGQLYNTNEVAMPNMFDFIFRLGYKQDRWYADVFYAQQNTLGGGDIERQNMPFVSNRMNAGKIGASALWFTPWITNLGVRAWGDYTITGRNVGQTTSLFGGLVYRIAPKAAN